MSPVHHLIPIMRPRMMLASFAVLSFTFSCLRARAAAATGMVVRYSDTQLFSVNRIPESIDSRSTLGQPLPPDSDRSTSDLEAAKANANSDEHSNKNSKGDSAVENANYAGSVQKSYYVEIGHAPSDAAPSFVANLKRNLITAELIQQMASYNNQLDNFDAAYGYYVQSRDSRGVRPYGLSAEQEQQMRVNMARQTIKYIFWRGIPHFLESLEATKKIGEKTQKLQEISQAAKFKVKTEAGWELNSGFNPDGLRVFAKLSNSHWRFETGESFDRVKTADLKSRLLLVAARSFGTWFLQAQYHLDTQYASLEYHRVF